MKHLAVCLVGIALLAGGVAFANDVEGTIQTIQPADPSHTMVVLDTGPTLVVDNHTTVTKDGQQARLEDLQPGERVKASYDEQDGQNIASSLEVQK